MNLEEEMGMEELYLVTGAAGHLGSALVDQLLKAGKPVRALVLPKEKDLLPKGVDVFVGDVTQKESLAPFFANPDQKELIVLHCAGIVSIASKYSQKVYDVNVGGTKNVVDLCREQGVKKLIYVSSVHAIPELPRGEIMTEIDTFDPEAVVGLYAKTKAEATAYVLSAAKVGLPVSVVHPSGISGPFDCGRGHLTTLVLDYCKHRLTSGIQGGYDFVDVRDVAQGILACCTQGQNGQCYILSNRYYTVREVLTLLHEITGKKEIKTYLPLWFVKGAAPLAELYYKIRRQPPLFTAYSIYTLNSNAVFSHEKATKELGFAPRDLRETLEDTVDWLKQNHQL